MRYILLLVPFLLGALPASSNYSELLYKKVNGLSVDTSTGVVIPNGEKVGISKFIATGSMDPQIYVFLAWCWGTGSQKILASTSGNLAAEVDFRNADNQVTGDGSCKLQIVIDNDSISQSNFVGGRWEAIKI